MNSKSASRRQPLRTVPRLLLATTTTLMAAMPALAQVSPANVRALNVARQWAINANGGLGVYRPAACMFETANGGGSCLVKANDEGFFFRFTGGPPGWQSQGLAPSSETDIQISADGRTVVNVGYNGKPR